MAVVVQVVRSVGKAHNLSAALLTGGKKEFREEQRRIVRMNIVVATPVRPQSSSVIRGCRHVRS